jgi:phospholipid transport system transporter-binding protein
MIQGSASPYRIVAPMTYATAAELFACGKGLLANGEAVFDLAAVPNADSSALAVLLGWQRAAGKGRLHLINLPASAISLAELYGVTEMLGSA